MGISISGRARKGGRNLNMEKRGDFTLPIVRGRIASLARAVIDRGQFSVVFLRYFILHGCTDEYSLPKEKGKIWDHSFSFLSTLEIERNKKKSENGFSKHIPELEKEILSPPARNIHVNMHQLITSCEKISRDGFIPPAVMLSGRPNTFE